MFFRTSLVAWLAGRSSSSSDVAQRASDASSLGLGEPLVSLFAFAHNSKLKSKC